MLRNKFKNTSHEVALKWMPHNMFDDRSTLVQLMVWCCQASTWANVARILRNNTAPFFRNGLIRFFHIDLFKQTILERFKHICVDLYSDPHKRWDV